MKFGLRQYYYSFVNVYLIIFAIKHTTMVDQPFSCQISSFKQFLQKMPEKKKIDFPFNEVIIQNVRRGLSRLAA